MGISERSIATIRTQAEYEKLYALHMLMKDMSSPVKKDDVTSNAATAPRRPPGSSGAHLRTQHHGTDPNDDPNDTDGQARPPSDYVLDTDGTAYVDEDGGTASLSPTKQQIFRLSEQERIEALQGVKDGTVSIDDALQCIALGRPIRGAAAVGAQYDRHTSQEVREAVLKSAEHPGAAAGGTELPGQARDVTIARGHALPWWLTAEVLRDELVACLHENRELSESIGERRICHCVNPVCSVCVFDHTSYAYFGDRLIGALYTEGTVKCPCKQSSSPIY